LRLPDPNAYFYPNEQHMKNLILLFFLFPLFGNAQDSCKLKRSTDEFTHVTKVTTGFVSFPVNGVPLSISIDATKTEVDFFFWINEPSKCFDETSTAQVNFDGERLKANYKNSGSMNCEGAFHFTFRNSTSTPSNLLRLTDKKISSIKLIGNGKSETVISFTEEQKQQLMRMAACVVREAKTLL
jgi:hypothetical protein